MDSPVIPVPTSLDIRVMPRELTLQMSNVFVAPADVKYNAEKEEKAKQERKQRQLEAVELTWQIEVEKKKENGIP